MAQRRPRVGPTSPRTTAPGRHVRCRPHRPVLGADQQQPRPGHRHTPTGRRRGPGHLDTRTGSGRRQYDEYHHDRRNGHHCLERTATVTLRTSAARPGTSASSLGSESSAKTVAADSPIPGSGAVCRAQPDSSCGPERVLGCGTFRGAKSPLLDHGHSHRRNTSAHNRGAPWDPVGGVRCAAWEKIYIYG